MAEYVDRQMEIVNATQEALRYTSNWMRDIPGGAELALPAIVIQAIKNMVIVAQEGEVPQSCQTLYIHICRLGEELRQYIQSYDGKVSRNGAPVGSFWGAIGAVETEVNKTDVIHITQLESVADLRSQQVSDEQIAFHIYGHRMKGPFVNAHGIVNKRLLDQAAKSVEQQDEILKACGWPSIDGVFFPPWLQGANNSRKEESAERLKCFKMLEMGPKEYVDPGTFDDMILDGCYVQDIEKRHKKTRNQVLDRAKELGVETNDKPGWTMRVSASTHKPIVDDPSNPEIPPDDNPDVVDNQPSEQVAPVFTTPNDKKIFSRDDLKSSDDTIDDQTIAAIRSIVHGNPTFGIPEIIADLEQDSMMATQGQVKAVLAAIKKEERSRQRK